MDRLVAKYGANGVDEEDPTGAGSQAVDNVDDSATLATDAELAGELSAAQGQRQGQQRRGHRNKAEETAHKIREAFYVLTQGVDVMHYKKQGRRSDKVRQVIWLEPDILRVCIDSRRLTASDVLNGKTAPGLYLRDIAEVRAGASSFPFKQCATPPSVATHCMCLIGTERTLCLEFPSKGVRDWFLDRFRLVLEDVLTPEEVAEREQRARKHGLLATLSPEESNAATQMLALLKRGIQILHHNRAGRVVRSSVHYNSDTMRLEVTPADVGFFGSLIHSVTGGPANLPASLHVGDVVEIRLGAHAYGFVASDSTGMGQECMTVVGTEGTLDLQLATGNARDLFAAKLRIFVTYWALHIAQEDDSAEEEQEQEEGRVGAAAVDVRAGGRDDTSTVMQ